MTRMPNLTRFSRRLHQVLVQLSREAGLAKPQSSSSQRDPIEFTSTPIESEHDRFNGAELKKGYSIPSWIHMGHNAARGDVQITRSRRDTSAGRQRMRTRQSQLFVRIQGSSRVCAAMLFQWKAVGASSLRGGAVTSDTGNIAITLTTFLQRVRTYVHKYPHVT